MSGHCDELTAFVDGELPPEAAQRFRDHLAVCPRCPAELSAMLQLGALVRAAADGSASRPRLRLVRGDARPALATGSEVVVRPAREDVLALDAPEAAPPRPAPHTSGPRRSPLGPALFVLGGMAAGAAAVFVLSLPRAPAVDGTAAPTRAAPNHCTRRPLEGRLSAPWADVHCAYSTLLGSAHPYTVDHQALARFHQAGYLPGVVAAYVDGREVAAANRVLSAPRTADEHSDKAALLLALHEPAEAIAAAAAALAVKPDHPQARWNRALALEQLSLDAAAAEAFAELAAGDAGGWGREAAERADRLRTEVAARRDAWRRAAAAGEALVRDGTPIPIDAVRRDPGLARLSFYDAVRVAPSAARVLALRPLALALDGIAGGAVLERHLLRVAASDFRVRAPEAARYRALLRGAGPGEPAAVDQRLASLRRSGASDILLGTFIQLGPAPEHLAEARRLAEATADPWFVGWARRLEGQALVAAGDLTGALAVLRTAHAACQPQGIDYRCVEIAYDLAHTLHALHLSAEARRIANGALRRAREAGAWGREIILLQGLAQMSRFDRDAALAFAYLDEVAARSPDHADAMEVVILQRAHLHLVLLRPEAARRELDRLPPATARGSRGLALADALADLAHFADARGEAASARAIAEPIAGDPREPLARRAHAAAVLGRAHAATRAPEARSVLEQVIATVDGVATPGGRLRRVRAVAFLTLVDLVAREGDFAGALALLAREKGLPAPTACALGASVDHDRLTLVARGVDGEVVGHHERRDPTTIEPGRLLPPRVEEVLARCPSVDVYAGPPLLDDPSLLPTHLAFAYRAHRRSVARTRAPSRLIVSGIYSPDTLRDELPRTPLVTPGHPFDAAAGDVALSGERATPGAFLRGVVKATDVEVHAHGLQATDVSDVPFLVLAADERGRYALTADDLEGVTLRGAPIVYLASCRAARSGPNVTSYRSLPMAFLAAGARAVVASPREIDAAEAARFFDDVRRRAAANPDALPAVLRRVKAEWLARNPESSVRSMLLYQ